MNATISRKDVHAPSQVQPEDYRYIAPLSEKDAHFEETRYHREALRSYMEGVGATWSTHAHGGRCGCCGNANAIYLVAFHHVPTNTVVKIGSTCAEKLDLGFDASEMNLFIRSCRNANKLSAAETQAEETLASLGLVDAFVIYMAKGENLDTSWEGNTVRDIVGKLVKYGPLSEKQVSFLRSLQDKIANRPFYEAQRASEKALALDCPTGRILITGTVVAKKLQESQFGDTLKMLVKSPQGWTCWGTHIGNFEKGDIVEFTATLSPSQDPKHGFFSRPTIKKKK